MGSEVSASPDLISSFSLTIICEPIGKTSVEKSPFSSLMFILYVPSSFVSILLMIPDELEVNSALLLLSPFG